MSYPCPFHTLFGFRLRLTERRLWPEQEGRKRGPLFLLPMVELAVMASRFGECDRDGGCTQCSPLSSRSLVLGAMPPFTHEAQPGAPTAFMLGQIIISTGRTHDLTALKRQPVLCGCRQNAPRSVKWILFSGSLITYY